MKVGFPGHFRRRATAPFNAGRHPMAPKDGPGNWLYSEARPANASREHKGLRDALSILLGHRLVALKLNPNSIVFSVFSPQI